MTQRGAPRSESARSAILVATARLFAERGYAGLTIEGIAAAAGVGKQTIYRWWPGKGDVLAECLVEGMILPEQLTPRSTGDLRADLRDWVQSIFSLLEDADGRTLFTSLIAAAGTNAAMGRRLRDSLVGDESLGGVLRAAQQSGRLPADVPVAEFGEALVGAVIMKAITGDPVGPADTDTLLDALLGSWRG